MPAGRIACIRKLFINSLIAICFGSAIAIYTVTGVRTDRPILHSAKIMPSNQPAMQTTQVSKDHRAPDQNGSAAQSFVHPRSGEGRNLRTEAYPLTPVPNGKRMTNIRQGDQLTNLAEGQPTLRHRDQVRPSYLENPRGPDWKGSVLQSPVYRETLQHGTGLEPFGAVTTGSNGDIWLKWQAIRNKITSEAAVLARCRADLDHCPSAGAKKFIAIVTAAKTRRGIARIGEINRAINLAIRPMSDLAQYGVEDYWASPLESLTHGAGDCEDYAIAKYAALHAAGFDERDLRLVIVRDLKVWQDHAILVVQINGHWRVLDNRRFLMLEDTQLPDYEPLFVLADGARRVIRYGVRVLAQNKPIMAGN